MTFKQTVLVVATLGVGAGIGWTLHGAGDAEQPHARAEPTSRVMPAFTAATTSQSLDMDALRLVVREELAAAAVHGPSRPAAAALNPAPPSADLVARRRAASEEIQSMIRGGQWGNEQRAVFHQSIAMLDPEQGARLLREVTAAINEGAIQITTDGPPL